MKPLLFSIAAAILFSLSARAQTNEPAAVPITLTWDFDGDASFTLYKGDNVPEGSTNGLAPIVSGIPTKYITIILKPGVYTFAVTAVGLWGETEFSNLWTTSPAVVAPPRNLKGTNGAPNKPDQATVTRPTRTIPTPRK